MPGSALVLVVDDERPLVGVIASHLDSEGLGVVEAYDGESALALARAERSLARRPQAHAPPPPEPSRPAFPKHRELGDERATGAAKETDRLPP